MFLLYHTFFFLSTPIFKFTNFSHLFFLGFPITSFFYCIILFEKGRSILNRKCPIKEKYLKCQKCSPCAIVSGWGGAGAYSDGKLTLTTEFGGILDEYIEKEKQG